jgi:hypothetical protein
MLKLSWCIFLLLLCISGPASSQIFKQRNGVTEKLLENTHSWSEGSVLLNDGKELSGLLRFDDNTGVLSYKNGDDSRTLIARSCAGFEFYDETLEKQRVFYVFSYEDKDNPKKFYFFEVLKEFKKFAVLSKVDPIEVEQRTSGGGGYYGPTGTYMPGQTYSSTEINQTETIFFMGANGEIKPYLRIVEKEIDGIFSRTRTKNRFIEEELFEFYTQGHYNQLVSYADKNDLSFKRKKDIVSLLNEYETLLSK